MRYEESIEIDKNGAGRATIILARPDANAERDPAAAVLAAVFGVSFSEESMTRNLPQGVTCEYRKNAAGGRVEVKATYAFDDIHKLIGWAASTNSPFNNISLVRKGSALEYSRAFCPLKPAELQTVREYLPSGTMVFRFTGPGNLARTNAAWRVEKTATWNFSAPELLAGRTLQAQYACGWPVWAYLLAALVAGMGALVLVRLWRARRGLPQGTRDARTEGARQ